MDTGPGNYCERCGKFVIAGDTCHCREYYCWNETFDETEESAVVVRHDCHDYAAEQFVERQHGEDPVDFPDEVIVSVKRFGVIWRHLVTIEETISFSSRLIDEEESI